MGQRWPPARRQGARAFSSDPVVWLQEEDRAAVPGGSVNALCYFKCILVSGGACPAQPPRGPLVFLFSSFAEAAFPFDFSFDLGLYDLQVLWRGLFDLKALWRGLVSAFCVLRFTSRHWVAEGRLIFILRPILRKLQCLLDPHDLPRQHGVWKYERYNRLRDSFKVFFQGCYLSPLWGPGREKRFIFKSLKFVMFLWI